MTPTEFIRKWHHVALTERASAQTHFNDLCALLGHEDPIKADPTGEWFAFEKGVTKTGGDEGFADVWKRNFFAWEYKRKKRDLNQALDQLVRYASALENPPLQVACDTDRFLVRTAWTNAVPETYEIALDELADPEKLDILRWVFFDPEKLRPKQTRAGLTKEAADKFSTIALRLQGRGTPEEIAHFVNQLVFCFFASSVKLLPDGFFPKLLNLANETPDQSKQIFDDLFAAMEKGGRFGIDKIAWFNGGLFDGRRALPLDSGDIGLLQAAASLDWSQIDPSIFGTLFERFLDPQKRKQIGAHYTDADKIMMIVEPVILRPLHEEWAATREEIEGLLKGKTKPPKGTKRRPPMSTEQTAAEEVRARYIERLKNVSILDPACGSGNFLYLALQGVKDIENRANLESEALGLPPRVNEVGPEILHGIEINPVAAELARTAIWIGDIQWRRRNGIYHDPPPILRKLDNIECRDALIEEVPPPQAGTSEIRWSQANWPTAEFIVGNPPFLGVKKMRAGLGQDYTQAIRRVYEGRVDEFSDLVCWWFEKARAGIVAGKAKRVGLVATNSIRGGENRKTLDAITRDLRLFEAWSDEPWIVEGAAVRVSLVCFSSKDTHDPLRLNGLSVTAINPDLTFQSNVSAAQRLSENRDVAFIGMQKSGPHDINGSVARSLLQLPSNPNGEPNSRVVAPYANGLDIVRHKRDKWIIDFDDLDEQQASLFEGPFELLKELVAKYIEAQKVELRRKGRADLADQYQYRWDWWRLWRPRPELKRALVGLRRAIVVPEVAKHRIFVWLDTRVRADKNLTVISRDDETTFGVLSSRFHEVWSLRLGTSLEDRPRYTPTTTFETFPFPRDLTPDLSPDDYADNVHAIAIGKAARRLDGLRNAWLNPSDLIKIEPEVVPGYPDRVLPKDAEAGVKLKQRTLTKLYNERPQWLDDAHRELDAAVAAAYGWPADISEEDALAKLLELNLARAEAERLVQPANSHGSRKPQAPRPGWRPGLDEEGERFSHQTVIGREAFAKISEVEGIYLSDEAKRAFAEFDRKKLTPEQRREAVIARFKREPAE